jgi:hypothetical protein
VSIDAFFMIGAMVIGGSTLVRSLGIYGQSVCFTESAPERVRRLVETASHLQKLDQDGHKDTSSNEQKRQEKALR